MGNTNDEKPLLVTDEESGDTYFTGSLGAGLWLADQDRYIGVEEREGVWRVGFYDDAEMNSEAEWGSAASLDGAYRFALGAMFGPADDEYDESVLREALAEYPPEKVVQYRITRSEVVRTTAVLSEKALTDDLRIPAEVFASDDLGAAFGVAVRDLPLDDFLLLDRMLLDSRFTETEGAARTATFTIERI